MNERQDICERLISAMGNGFVLKTAYDFQVVDAIINDELTFWEGADALKLAHGKWKLWCISKGEYEKYLKDRYPMLYAYDVL